MKSFKLAMITLMTLMSFQAVAGTSNLVKTDREDFGALIAEGLETQKELRKELRQEAGLPELDKGWAEDINANGRVLMGVVEAENVVSPTTKYVRKAPVRQQAQDYKQKRIAVEYDSMSH